MKDYKSNSLRNIGLIGHCGSGKTSLMENLLYHTKEVDRIGRVEDGTTISDYDAEEKKRQVSISTSVACCEWNNIKINLVDMPGYFDFEGEVIQGLCSIDTALITVCGVSGIEVGTEKAWDYAVQSKLPRAIFINKLDRENSNFEETLEQLKEKFGTSVVPIQYPIGKENDFKGIINIISNRARIFNSNTNSMDENIVPVELVEKVDECKQMLMEAIAETDEELLEKYFSEGELSNEEIYQGLVKGMSKGEICPIMCGSAITGVGIQTLLEDMVECFPSPVENRIYTGKTIDGKEIDIHISQESPFSAMVFKTVVDPFIGKLSMFRVITGAARSDSLVYNSSKEKDEKLGTLYFLKGKKQTQTNEVKAGDIGAVAKLQYTSTGDTLCSSGKPIIYERILFPSPVYSRAVIANGKGDEDKISNGLARLLEEDPTFSISRDVENAEIVISGLGSTHLEIIVSKLKSKFGAEVVLKLPKTPYRETIKKFSDVQGKHKKQSGGHGQYGDVKIKFEPRSDEEDELQFIDAVVGGAVPRQYIPAVEKGLRECITHGVLAGYPVIRLKATLYDGSFHPVDSSEMAFKIASSLAYKKGLQDAQPILLEPIMYIEVDIPDDYMGDVIADINKKRGKILGMEPGSKGQRIIGEVPQSELYNYATDLRSITGARGSFSSKFQRYEEVPNEIINKIIADIKKEA